MANLLPRRLLAANGALAVPLAALGLPIYVVLPATYSSELGISAALVGLVLLLARLFDVVIDPIIGLLSDSLCRGGRSRLYLAWLGLPLTVVAAWLLLVPLAGANWLYLLAFSLLLYLGWSLLAVPLAALGAELSPDYHQRSRVTHWREAGAALGALAGLVLVALGQADGQKLQKLALFIVILLPLSLLWLQATLPAAQKLLIPNPRWREGWRLLLANHAFRRLLLAYFINALASAFPATLFMFYVEHYLAAKDWAGKLLVLYFLSAVLAVPIWLWLSQRLGKGRCWALAMLLSVVVFAVVPFIPSGQAGLAWFIAVTILTGLPLGADIALPAAMQADAIDNDPRSGLYFALLAMASKLALAFAVGIAFPSLQFFGFAPPDALSLTPLVVFYALLPVLLKSVAIYLVWKFFWNTPIQ